MKFLKTTILAMFGFSICASAQTVQEKVDAKVDAATAAYEAALAKVEAAKRKV